MPQELQIQPMITPGSYDEKSDEDFAIIHLSSPSAGLPPSAEQRNRPRRFGRSKSRERVPPHSSSHARQQPQPVVPPPTPGIQQNHAVHSEDENPASVGPQNGVSDHSRSPQDQEDTKTRYTRTKRKRKILQKSCRVHHRRPRSTNPWIQMRTMKNLKMGLELLQTVNLLYQSHLFIKDQQPVRKDQLTVSTLRMKTVQRRV